MKHPMLKLLRALCLVPVTALFLLSVAAQAQAATTSMDGKASAAAVEVRMAMRQLWEEHIVYTRNYIISDLAGLPDKDAVAQRLLRNQDDIGNAIKPYADIKAYDEGHAHMLMFADALTDGIAKQFPDKFK